MQPIVYAVLDLQLSRPVQVLQYDKNRKTFVTNVRIKRNKESIQ